MDRPAQMNTKSVVARIRGRVQGVGFRAWTHREARARNLVGWVRNEPDGSVRALLAGGAGDVEKMLASLERGPDGSQVESVETEPAEIAGIPASFEVRY